MTIYPRAQTRNHYNNTYDMNPGKYVAHKTLILMSVAIISLMW